MNVTFDKIDNVNATLTISIQENDYQDEFKTELKKFGRNHPLKGFRPGHVPEGILRKHFGPDVLARIIDKRLGKELNDYITNNNVHLLGEPVITPDTKVDVAKDKDFTFKFDLGLEPEFDVKVDDSVKVPYYTIEVSQDMVDKQIAAYRKRYGRQVPGEESTEDAVLRGTLTELDENGAEKTDGIKAKKSMISPKYLKDDDEKQKFIGKKVGEEIVYNPYKSVDGNINELAAVLNVDKEHADVQSDFKFVPTEILVNQDAELNQELFDDVLGKDVAKDENEFADKVKEMIAGQLKNDSNYRFTIDAENVLREQVGELELPDEFLKRFLVAQDEKKDAKSIEENYPNTRKQIVWQLIKEKVAHNYNVEIGDEDVLKVARFFAVQQFAQYGMSNLPADVIEKYAKELLEKKEYAREISNRAFEEKVFATIKENVKLTEKTVSLDEFNKLFEAKEEK